MKSNILSDSVKNRTWTERSYSEVIIRFSREKKDSSHGWWTEDHSEVINDVQI